MKGLTFEKSRDDVEELSQTVILFNRILLYTTHKEIEKVVDFRFVINKGTRIVSDRVVATSVDLIVKEDKSLRSALKVIWDEIFDKSYSEWIEDEDYVPFGFEDPEDLERVLQEEPETFFDALDPFSGEHFVDRVYRNGKLIYSYDA